MERLYISKLLLVPESDLYEGVQDEEIIFKSKNYEPTYFTPGSCFFSWDRKENASGFFYANEISFSFPGSADDQMISDLNKTGAVVAITNADRKIVFYKNDYFSNQKMVPQVNGNGDRTAIKFTINSLDVL